MSDDLVPPEPFELAAGLESTAQSGDAKVSGATFWWGFEVYLNRYAVQLLLHDEESLVALAVKALERISERLAVVVKLYIVIRKVWISAITDDGKVGCKLWSPWPVPGMLVPASWDDGEGGMKPAVPAKKANLWWSHYDVFSGWSERKRFPAQHSSVAPALATSRSGHVVVCVHRGVDSDDRLYLTYCKKGKWTVNEPLPAHRTATAPALAYHYSEGALCIHRGSGNDDRLYWSVRGLDWDESAWTKDTPIEGAHTAGAPALTIDDNTITCVFRGTGNDEQLYWTQCKTFRPDYKWSTPQPIAEAFSPSGASIASEGQQQVCVFRDNKYSALYWTWRDVTSNAWAPIQSFERHWAHDDVALTHFKSDGKKTWTCVYRKLDGNELVYATADSWDPPAKLRWSAEKPLGGHYSVTAAGIAYADREVFCVHGGTE